MISFALLQVQDLYLENKCLRDDFFSIHDFTGNIDTIPRDSREKHGKFEKTGPSNCNI